MMEALTLHCLIATKASIAAFDHMNMNSPFFRLSVIGAMIVLDPLINHW